MKTWTKPLAATVDAGFEVTRYLPSELDISARRGCMK
jgi:coenzyme PQQ precursor peptide PqqA